MNRTIKVFAMLFAALACWGLAQAQTHFTEVAARAGVSDSERNAVNSAPCWGDYDNDGFLDLYVNT